MARSTGYGQFCPVALASEAIAERWTPLVIRELLCGARRFNDIQRGVPRMSPALLASRLRSLEFSGIVQRGAGVDGLPDYSLTAAGLELRPLIDAMGVWSQRWLRHRLVADDTLDPNLLMWDIRRRVAPAPRGTAGRHVTEFRLACAPRARHYWLVRDTADADLCHKDPGFDVDLLVSAELRTMTEIWLGHIGLAAALRQGALRLDGAPAQIRAFRDWFSLSSFAPAARAPRAPG